MAVRVPYDGSIFGDAVPRTSTQQSIAPQIDQSYGFEGAFEPQYQEATRTPGYQAPAGGTPTVPATAQPTTPTQIINEAQRQDYSNSIGQWYRQYLGREGSAGEIAGWVNNPNGIGTVENAIRNSPEAAAYAARQQTPTAAPAGAPTQLSTRQPQITAMSQQSAPIGFDAAKWADPTHQTDKYVAGKLAQAGNTMPDIVAALNANGQHRYTQVGDDSVQDENGDIYDVWYDFDNATGQKHPQWTLVGGPTWEAQNGGGGGGFGAGGGFGGGSGAAIPSWLQSMFGGGGGGGGGNAFLPGGFSQDGADPMSALIDSGTAGLILNGGATPFSGSLQAQLMQLIANGGVSPDIATKLIGAREHAALAQQGMLEDARAALAGQGALSVPGVQQGTTDATIGKISEKIAPEFADALRDIYGQALDQSNQSFMNALQVATGLSQQESNALLNALGQGTSRQQVMAGIALDSLAQNMDWNKFLAQHSLDQSRLAEDISQGRISNVVQLLQLFLQGAGTASNGYIDQ